jgi:hypothetical protein
MTRKRNIQKDAEALVLKLLTLPTASIAQARRMLAELLMARAGTVVTIGITPEARHELRHVAKDAKIEAWRQQIFERLRNDAEQKGNFVGQGIQLDKALVSTSPHGITFELDGDLGELLAMQAYLIVRIVGRNRLQICDCGDLFLRTGKRKFCSDRCQKRVYMRLFRNPENTEEEYEHGKKTR